MPAYRKFTSEDLTGATTVSDSVTTTAFASIPQVRLYVVNTGTVDLYLVPNGSSDTTSGDCLPAGDTTLTYGPLGPYLVTEIPDLVGSGATWTATVTPEAVVRS